MKKLVLLASFLSVAAMSQILWSGPPDEFKEKIVMKVLRGGKLIVGLRKDTPNFYPEGTQIYHRVWQEVYGCSNGVVVLEKTVEGIYHPETQTPERIDWGYPPDRVSVLPGPGIVVVTNGVGVVSIWYTNGDISSGIKGVIVTNSNVPESMLFLMPTNSGIVVTNEANK